MKMEWFFSKANNRVLHGIYVTEKSLKELKERFPDIFIPKNGSERLLPREDGIIGAIISYKKGYRKHFK